MVVVGIAAAEWRCSPSGSFSMGCCGAVGYPAPAMVMPILALVAGVLILVGNSIEPGTRQIPGPHSRHATLGRHLPS